MESAKQRRERRRREKKAQVEIWRQQLGIQGFESHGESYEESFVYFVLKKAMELITVKEGQLQKLELENLALASKNGPRELKIQRLEERIKELKNTVIEKEAETENFKAQIWFPGFDNYNQKAKIETRITRKMTIKTESAS